METFLICNTGAHTTILGIKWLEAHNLKINWNMHTPSFPHSPPDHVAIVEEEEGDPNPLEGVPSQYHHYTKVFGEEEFNKLPPHCHYDTGIEHTEEGPLNSPLYSMTNTESATLKDWLRDELKAGKICPSKSPISSPVMFVPKKYGSCQLVVDYQHLNNWTKKNIYPLPHPNDLMAQLCSTKDYTNVQVKEGNKWKTAFCTKYGLYKSLVMTFGFTNAPAAFQHFMNKLFKDLLDVCIIIYLDDILIYSKDNTSHPQHVHEVLKCLMENQLFYSPWKWTEKEQSAFQALKDSITNAPVLAHANPTKPYFLETNASSAALGSILSQQQEDGCLHPLGFLSKSFKGAEQNYDTHNKELLAILRSFEYWCIFLEGTLHPVTMFTDLCNLEYWKESRTCNCRHARWHLLLASYNFQIVYCPGKQSGKPDALPRCSNHADISLADQTMLPNPVFANIALITPKRELQHQIEASLDQDKSLEEILTFLQNESKAPPSIKQAFKDYKVEAGLLFYQGCIVVPDIGTLCTDLLCIFHDSPLAGHPG
ncbi:Retrotransposable element Tf2 protein [Rhizoctonia solani]|uniref:Retrotransposable element Tf2 protein n=1 Tax=Rhizoctonia solani TaxID=456999 RepID=A0A8H8T0C1_9AGAM|nr:Retrotransposable element Tf2 protein [Rhizoctonia solani]QRW23517.1 Retrotransposable element Tf2 protein [Rhizoctonia solani]